MTPGRENKEKAVRGAGARTAVIRRNMSLNPGKADEMTRQPACINLVLII